MHPRAGTNLERLARTSSSVDVPKVEGNHCNIESNFQDERREWKTFCSRWTTYFRCLGTSTGCWSEESRWEGMK